MGATSKAPTPRPYRTPESKLRPKAAAVHEASLSVDAAIWKYLGDSNFDKRDHVYTLKHRVKSTDDIVSKVKRKRSGAKRGSKEWHYEPHHVTDGCGYRIVTVFQMDILHVIRDIISMIKHETKNSPFVKGRLKEAIIYTNRPKDEKDSIHSNVKDLLEKGKFIFDEEGYSTQIKDPENKKSGYSSVHLVAYVEAPMRTTNGTTTIQNVAVEIQIRDIFEEAWGEIDHALRYVVKREENDAEQHPLVKQWRPHLNALKAFADGCSQHASLIKQNAIDSVRIIGDDGQKSLDSAEETLPVLFSVLPDKYHGKLRDAYDARDAAAKLVGSTNQAIRFAEAAQLFRNILESLSSTHLNKQTDDDRDVEYHLKMDMAFCLSSNPESTEPEVIYKSMAERFKDDATAPYRLHKLSRRAKDYKGALLHLETAGKRLQRDTRIDARNWINAAVPRLIGYTHWLMAEQTIDDGNNSAALKELEVAVQFCHTALQRAEQLGPDERHEIRKAVNNNTYFVMRYLECNPKGKRGVANPSILKHLCTKLENCLRQSRTTNIYSLDTLWRAYQTLNDSKCSEETFERLAESLLSVARQNAGSEKVTILNARTHLPDDLQSVANDVLKHMNT